MSKLQDYLDHNPQLEGEEYLWKKSAAAALEVSEKTLERAAKNGKIKAIEKSRKILYSIDDLREFEADQTAEIHKPTVEPDTPGQTQTDSDNMKMNQTLMLGQIPPPAVSSFTNAPDDYQQRLVVATVQKAENEAKRAYFEGNQTFALDEAAEILNLSITDLKRTAKTFRGKNQRLMITKNSLQTYLENL